MAPGFGLGAAPPVRSVPAYLPIDAGVVRILSNGGTAPVRLASASEGHGLLGAGRPTIDGLNASTGFWLPVPLRSMSGLGAAPSGTPEHSQISVLAAVRRAGQRAVLLTGWGGLRAADSGDDVLVVDEVPHSWLFPHMAAVVHHGGAGTTGTALHSGTPSIVVPSFADQFFWGERVQSLGVGVNLPRRQLSVSALIEAIEATRQPNLRRRATELGTKLAVEDGVSRAGR